MRLQKQFSFQTEDQIQNLVNLAQKQGFKSASGLLQAIATGEVVLEMPATPTQQQALVKAVFSLRDTGDVAAVREMATLLLERGLLSQELRFSIDGSFSPLFAPWIIQLEEYLEQKQPFELSYSDAAGRVWTYTVRYAQICFREKRNYLECWCDQTQGNQDIPELEHNWSLRLDHINDAGIVPINGEWRKALDEIAIEFDLLDGLAHAYQKRPNDIEVEWISVEPRIRRVMRSISNTFWFVREILPYGKDCVVRSPIIVRQKILKHLEAACNHYK